MTDTIAIHTFAVSSNERTIIVSSNETGAYNWWAIDVATKEKRQLTDRNQRNHHPVFIDDERFLFATEEDGNEQWQLYEWTGKEARPVMERTAGMTLYPFVRPHYLYYTSTKDNPAQRQGYRRCWSTGLEQMIVPSESEAQRFIAAVSPTERSLIIRENYSTSNERLLWQEGAECRSFIESDAVFVMHSPQYITEQTVYFLTNYEADYQYVAQYDGTMTSFVKLENMDITKFVYSEYLYVIAERGVRDVLYRWRAGEMEHIPLPVAVVEQIEAVNGTLYILGQSATTPMNIYRYDGVEWQCMTNFTLETEAIAPEVMAYSTFDSLQLEALYYEPKVANGYTFMWLHGGPQWAERAVFKPLFQRLVQAGYAVVAPNVRGSTGYGTPFMKLVERDWGGGPRLDVIATMDWLEATKRAQPGKWIVSGSSYGGYLALLVHGRHPERVAAVVDLYGPTNLLTLIETAPPTWRASMREWVGNPVDDYDLLVAMSPITYAAAMTKPMLIIQGANDRRVVPAESEQLIERVPQAEYMLLTDEGHGVTKKVNERAVHDRMVQFLNEVLCL